MNSIITPLSLNSYCISEFTLPERVQEQLEKYYLLRWEGAYLFSHTFNNLGRILHQGVQYLAIYHRETTQLTPELFPDSQFEISFRKIKGDQYGYALIRKLGQSS